MRMKTWISLVGVLIFVVAFFMPSLYAQEKAEYVGDNENKCKVCHPEQMKLWLQWKMAKTFDVLKDKEKEDPKCVKCHVTGFGEKGGFKSLKDTPKLVNVQCEACHGPASLHLKAPITDKEKRRATVKKPTKADCEKCHNKESPQFKGFDYDKYLEKIKHWKDEK